MCSSVYGPFLDEEFFSYHDANTIRLDSLEIFHEDLGYIGFNDLDPIYNQGREGSFDKVFFSGVTTLMKTSYLCERGFKNLLREVERRDPTMSAERLRKHCKQEKIKVEIQCQLGLMPVCYLTKSPANSILVYSKNLNKFVAGQRRYVVNTFHATCLRRSELTLQRYMVLKFVLDLCTHYRNDVFREDRDVHRLVQLYLEDYAAVFKRHQRPRLHRSEVYDHFATHAKWLRKVFAKKAVIDRSKWEEWIEGSKQLRKKAKEAGFKWGGALRRPLISQDDRQRQSRVDDYIAHDNGLQVMPSIIPGTDSEGIPSGADEETRSETDSSDGDVHYTYDPSLCSRAHPGLFRPMPLPTWYWACNIKAGCPFIITIGHKQDLDAPCVTPLSPKEKVYLRDSVWGLYDAKLGKIWKKMCQAHMDSHWRESGLILDHRLKRIYGVEEEDQVGDNVNGQLN